jgi:formylmethanofuran dehydrogenase subunit E
MAEFSLVRIVHCSGCGKTFPKAELQGIGNQFACAACMGIWRVK